MNSIAAAGFALLLGLGGGPESLEGRALHLIPEAVASNTPDVALSCGGCYQCSPTTIAFSITANPDHGWVGPIMCSDRFQATCEQIGPCSDTFGAILKEVEWLVATGDMNGLARTISANATQVILVGERSAVQIMDCSGQLVGAHVALGEKEVVTLQELVDHL